MGRMTAAVKAGDRRKMLEALLMKVAETLDGTDSGRDVAALSIKFVDILDKMEEDEPKSAGSDKTKPMAKVTTFEAIAGRRTERRAAAED
ncbi:MAG: hypothetical protein IKF14_10440 [Atopobiaceae bacterium]|nr:hypothetical protein [Atopobiaceae bacterium]